MEQQDIKNKIKTSLDKLRLNQNFSGSRGDTKLLELIATTQGQEKLDEIFSNVKLTELFTNSYSITAPTYVFNFISELSKLINPKSTLDPWLTISSPAVHLPLDNITGICRNQTEYEIINTVFENRKIYTILGDPISQLEKQNKKYDLILSFPPFGMRTEHINGSKSPTDFATALLLQSGKLLNDNGKIVFLLTPSFLINEKGKEYIEKAGLFIEAVFAIPSSAFAPMTSVLSNLIVLSKDKKDKTFVAEISQDETTNKSVFENYRNRKEGKAIQLGTLVNINEFKSLQALISQKEMQELVKRIGYPPILLTDIALSVNLLKQDNSEDVEHLPNSFYLPKVGNSVVVSSTSAMKIKPKNYFQIQLDETKANAVFVANYFNTQIGKKLRESMEVGSVILQISKSQLTTCTLHLPDLATQAELIEIDSKIDQFSLRLDELKRNLWKQPKSHKTISKDLKNINQEEKLEDWIDTLPFPISSILWRYYATKENGNKIEHLFHFFEAYSEFFTMIMLSALKQDEQFYRQECHKWIGTDVRFKDWYLRATFGNWNRLGSDLSKATRTYLADNDKKDYCKNIYGNPSDAFLNMLTNKGIINVLFEVANLRNKWKGHGGISSEEENKQRVVILEQQLNELRKHISDGFEETRMLSPTTSSFEDGMFTFNAKELVGARTPFNETSIKSLIPLDRKKLYLAHSNQNKPVELIPFIKYIEASDAIYFYTSIESKDVRWVSYHFDKEAEIKQPADSELFKAFDFLKS